MFLFPYFSWKYQFCWHVSHVLIVSIWRNFSLKLKNPQFLKSEVAKLGLFGVLEAFATIIYSKQEFISNNCYYCKFRINNFPPKIGFAHWRNFCLLTSSSSFFFFLALWCAGLYSKAYSPRQVLWVVWSQWSC